MSIWQASFLCFCIKFSFESTEKNFVRARYKSAVLDCPASLVFPAPTHVLTCCNGVRELAKPFVKPTHQPACDFSTDAFPASVTAVSPRISAWRFNPKTRYLRSNAAR
jgi:hypothetical protein